MSTCSAYGDKMITNSTPKFFDVTLSIGHKILFSITGLDEGTEKEQYLQLIEEIYRTLGFIHTQIIKITHKVDRASSIEEAKAALDAFNNMGLKKNFKANELCDELEMFGKKLRSFPPNLLDFSQSDKFYWDRLIEQLEQREGGVADLYFRNLDEIHLLRFQELPLSELKDKVNSIKRTLIIQKGAFELLADQAKNYQRVRN